ncbi:MAG: hypothetical protein ACRC62_31600 [Microcoleus sp.]
MSVWEECKRVDDAPVMENTIGIDMGLKSFFTDDEGKNSFKKPTYFSLNILTWDEIDLY